MRVSEIYASIQGEGPRVGKPTTFIRFGGCNLRCPGWPCDTQHAIDVQYRDEWIQKTPMQVFEEAKKKGPKNFCLTGGEPFLQPLRDLQRLTELALSEGITVECFSNGTLVYPKWALHTVHFIMDWKLPGSGEDMLNPTRFDNLDRLKSTDAVKFVCKDWEDYQQAKHLYDTYISLLERKPKVYVGVVWGKLEESALAAWLVQDQLPWLMNVQMHNYIWPANERRR